MNSLNFGITSFLKSSTFNFCTACLTTTIVLSFASMASAAVLNINVNANVTIDDENFVYTGNIVSDDQGTTRSSIGEGNINIQPQPLAIPLLPVKLIAWLLKIPKPLYSPSLLDISGGDIMGIFETTKGDDVSATFRLQKTDLSNAIATLDIVGNDLSLLDVENWTTTETFMPNGAGSVISQGITVDLDTGESSPFSIDYTFLGDTDAVLPRAVTVRQSGTFNLANGSFESEQVCIPESSNLLGCLLVGSLFGIHKIRKRY